MRKKHESGKKNYKIIITGNSIYPVRVIEHVVWYSIVGDVLLWIDFFDNNKKCYKVRAGEEVDVLTMNIELYRNQVCQSILAKLYKYLKSFFLKICNPNN